MSSKSAGAKAGKEILFQLMHLISKGKFAEIPASKIEYFKRYGYIERSRETYTLTQKGRCVLTENKIWALSISTPKHWDKKWRIVLFDIPVDKRKRRDSFRLRLKELGLIKYQNSVWIYPYPLEREIAQIVEFYHLDSCVSFIVAESISEKEKLMRQFGL
jgi:DNA-binding transcriptional regulator PaaX